MFVITVVFLDTFVLIALSCILKSKCPNYLIKEKTKNSRDKGLVATWSDTENDFFDEYVDGCGHFIAFAATIDKVIVERGLVIVRILLMMKYPRS